MIKIQSKPFISQIEEKAIEELKKFYNVSSCKDEIITVLRLQSYLGDKFGKRKRLTSDKKNESIIFKRIIIN